MHEKAAIRSFGNSFLMAVIMFVSYLLIPQPATAQQVLTPDPSPAQPQMPDNPNPALPARPSPRATSARNHVPPHAFWDRTNVALFSGVAVTRGMDYASTRNFQARGRQEILLPDDVVNSSAGFASLEAAATLTSVGISYLLHRNGHHALERWLSIGHIGVTGFGDVRNYSLESRHRAGPSHP
jgi:hypothetical protein